MICPHGIHMDNACGACNPPRGTTVRGWEACNPVCGEGYKSERFCAGICRPKRLQAAIEGECDGLAVDRKQARAILDYVDARRPLTDEQIAALVPGAQAGWSREQYCQWTARAVERAHGIGTGTAPVAWAVFARNGNVRLWSTDSEAVRKFATDNDLPLHPLFAQPVARPIRDDEIERIAGTDELTGDAILRFAHRLLEAVVNPAPLEGKRPVRS